MEKPSSLFQFSDDFFSNHVHHLSVDERALLFRFLNRLQENPYSPDYDEVREHYYAHEFTPGKAVCWFLRKKAGGLVTIFVLKIVTPRDGA